MELLKNMYENFGELFFSWLIFELLLMLFLILLMAKLGIEVDFSGGKKRKVSRKNEKALLLANEDLRDKCYEFGKRLEEQDSQINSIMDKNADLINYIDKLKIKIKEHKGKEAKEIEPGLLCNFLRGWMNRVTMSERLWAEGWWKAVEEAEEEGMELVIYRIPHNGKWKYITAIEDLLQKMTTRE